MQKEHISDEMIIAWLEGNLDVQEKEILEKMIQDNDSLFIRAVKLHNSLTEIEESKLEVTPDILLSSARKALEVKEIVNAGKTNEIIDGIGSFIKNLLKPKPFLAFVAVATLIIVITTRLGEEKSTSTMDFAEQGEIQLDKARDPIIPQFKTRGMATASKKFEISVELLNDTLIIKQPIRINRVLTVKDENETILVETINDLVNKVYIDDTSEKDSIRVSISTLDEVVFDEWIIIDTK